MTSLRTLPFSAFENCRNTALLRRKRLDLRLVSLRLAFFLAPCLAKIFYGKTIEETLKIVAICVASSKAN
jgi:hypothetical protein